MSPNVPRASLEVQEHYATQLAELIRAAVKDGIEIAGWISEALTVVATELPGGSKALVKQRPGSWEAEHIRRLAAGADYS